MKPSVCLVVGDNDTEHCGVKDYAIQLGTALRKIGLNAEVLAPSDWGVKSFFRFCQELRERNFDIVHVQYPSIGNRGSLCPHSLGLMRVAKGVVVTLHEYSALPFTQRLSTHLFRFTSQQLLFTVDTELINYGRSSVKQRVVHIGSNVAAFSQSMPRTLTVLYFGQIRPNKGIEEFLDLVRLSLRRGRNFKFKIIGSVPQRRIDYYKAVRATANPDVEWLIDLPAEEIGQLMANSLAAYLPFPDGASYRRGSLLATLTNGLPTITKVGPATARDMVEVLLLASKPEEALEHLDELFYSSGQASALSLAEKRFAERFSWTHIAQRHEQVYLETLAAAQPDTQGSQPLAPYFDSEDEAVGRKARNSGHVG